MKTWSEAGRGRKQCPACKIYIGVRTLKCTCGHDILRVYSTPKKTKAAQCKEESTTHSGYKEVLIIPSGAPMFELLSLSRKDVHLWCRELAKHYHSKEVFMEPTVPKYWARRYCDIFSEEYQHICEFVDELYKKEENLND